mmetsp:Transcript_65223/g.178963  ORF Transcript_65223/g.178963 Transcript_65223/m.178963 type:complete len:301 (+) Transcript_65223:198-1100(+)
MFSRSIDGTNLPARSLRASHNARSPLDERRKCDGIGRPPRCFATTFHSATSSRIQGHGSALVTLGGEAGRRVHTFHRLWQAGPHAREDLEQLRGALDECEALDLGGARVLVGAIAPKSLRPSGGGEHLPLSRRLQLATLVVEHTAHRLEALRIEVLQPLLGRVLADHRDRAAHLLGVDAIDHILSHHGGPWFLLQRGALVASGLRGNARRPWRAPIPRHSMTVALLLLAVAAPPRLPFTGGGAAAEALARVVSSPAYATALSKLRELPDFLSQFGASFSDVCSRRAGLGVSRLAAHSRVA